MFNCRQQIPRARLFVGSIRRDKVDENGFVTHEDVAENSPLPPTENFDLRVLLKAGVDVKKVQTRILGSQVAIAQMIEELGKENETTKTKEVNNG